MMRSSQTRRPARAALCSALLLLGGGCGGARRPARGEAPVLRHAASPACGADSARAAAPADVEITASVRMERLRVERRGSTRASFPGAGARDTLVCVRRVNLPDTLRAGQTYRDAGIDLRIRVRLDSLAGAAQPAARDSAGSTVPPAR